MTRDDLILAALPAVITTTGYCGDTLARAGTCLGSSTVAAATLEVADAIEAAISKEQQVEH